MVVCRMTDEFIVYLQGDPGELIGSGRGLKGEPGEPGNNGFQVCKKCGNL